MEETNKTQQKILLYLGVLSFFGVTGFLFGALNAQYATLGTQKQTANVLDAIPPHDPFEGITLTAKSALVFDVANNTTLFEQHAQTQLPLASITKVMIALLASEYLDESETVFITNDALLPEGDSGFELGESWRAQDLIDFTLMTSSNDGSAALAEAIVAKTGATDIATLMNERSQIIGMHQAYFVNETGLDSNDLFGGAYGSAHDIALLFKEVYAKDPELLATTAVAEHSFTNEQGKEYVAQNTNKAVHDIPGLVFGKTGFTDLAGGNLAVLLEIEPNHPIIVVVLGSTLNDRFEDVTTLVERVVTRHQE